MTNKDLIQKVFDISDKFNETVLKIENAITTQSEILRQINDQNRLHKQAVDVNTEATKDLTVLVREQTQHFNKMWIVFWVMVLALIVLAGAEEVLKFLRP